MLGFLIQTTSTTVAATTTTSSATTTTAPVYAHVVGPVHVVSPTDWWPLVFSAVIGVLASIIGAGLAIWWSQRSAGEDRKRDHAKRILEYVLLVQDALTIADFRNLEVALREVRRRLGIAYSLMSEKEYRMYVPVGLLMIDLGAFIGQENEPDYQQLLQDAYRQASMVSQFLLLEVNQILTGEESEPLNEYLAHRVRVTEEKGRRKPL